MIDRFKTLYYNVIQESGAKNMTVSLRLNKEEEMLIKKYAELKNMSLSELFRNALIEKIEDEYDIEAYKKAIQDYKEEDKTYTLEEAKKELGI